MLSISAAWGQAVVQPCDSCWAAVDLSPAKLRVDLFRPRRIPLLIKLTTSRPSHKAVKWK